MWMLGAAFTLPAATQVSAAPEKRCGWLENPSPANWWLNDKDGTWTLLTMGNEPVPGLDKMPDMSTKGWVVTNAGGHGYGCACLDLEIDPRTREVTDSRGAAAAVEALQGGSRVAGAMSRGAMLFVVVAAGHDADLQVVSLVDQTVRVVDTARPEAGEICL